MKLAHWGIIWICSQAQITEDQLNSKLNHPKLGDALNDHGAGGLYLSQFLQNIGKNSTLDGLIEKKVAKVLASHESSSSSTTSSPGRLRDDTNCSGMRTTYECCAAESCSLCDHGLLMEAIASLKPELLLKLNLDLKKMPLLIRGFQCGDGCGLTKFAVETAISVVFDKDPEKATMIKNLIENYNLMPETKYDHTTCPAELATAPGIPSQSPIYEGTPKQLASTFIASLLLSTLTI